jgi:hypothetical protein
VPERAAHEVKGPPARTYRTRALVSVWLGQFDPVIDSIPMPGRSIIDGIFTLTSGTPVNNPCTTYSLPFSHSFLLVRAPAATFNLNFIRLTITEISSLVTML